MAVTCSRSSGPSSQPSFPRWVLPVDKTRWNLHEVAIPTPLASRRSIEAHPPTDDTHFWLHQTQKYPVCSLRPSVPEIIFLWLVQQFPRLNRFARASLPRGFRQILKKIESRSIRRLHSGFQHQRPHASSETSHYRRDTAERICTRQPHHWETYLVHISSPQLSCKSDSLRNQALQS